ncbi:MAG: small nuclear ribonucleoprotein [Thermoplasmata archaeon]|nr:small nuclear ribonucleoprotein [Thermoplasmata archaeon]
MIKPIHALNESLNSRVIVELRNNIQYRGVLDGYDPHMNLVLKNTEEFMDGEQKRKLNLAIIRGDNVIYISPP